jgi:hypothetical protein
MEDREVTWLLPFLLLVILAAIGAGIGRLIADGFRAGDQPEDARVHVTHTWTRQPYGWVSSAHITVDNPSPVAVVASICVQPAPRWTALTAAPSVTVPRHISRPRPLPADEQTTVVAAGGSRSVVKLPLPPSALRARVTVVVHQCEGRVRIWRACLPVLEPRVPTPIETTPSAERSGR